MESALQVFSNEKFSVRALNENGEFWFVAKDVATALEYPENSVRQANNLFGSVPGMWKGHKRIMTLGGEQEMLCVTEQGLYFFLGRSDKPKALPYQMWIAGDVVPSIRKTGSYNAKKENAALSSGIIESARAVFESAGITGNQVTLALDKVFKSYTGRSALEMGEIVLTAPTKKQILTPTEIGAEFGLNAQRVNEILAGAGYQHKVAGKWEALLPGEPYAVMLDTGKKHSDGTPVRQLKWDSGILAVIRKLQG